MHTTLQQGKPPTNGVPLLMNGDRLTQPEFHRRYQAYPDNTKFELIGGIVYMSSPLRADHSDYDGKMALVLQLYEVGTPGVRALHNATTILGPDSEPQPDDGLCILPECGGRTRLNEQRYVEGPPELLVEIAHSSAAIDLHTKRDDYQRAGVQEYLVVCVTEQELRWFDFSAGEMIRPTREGVLKSRAFSGLWIDERALLALDGRRLMAVLEQGIAGRAHAGFVRRLEAQRRRRSQT